jgi:hypothetical protein
VNSKCCGATNKDKDRLLKRAPTRAIDPLTVSNRFSILEEDNTDEGGIIHSVIDSNGVNKNRLINQEDLQSKVGLLIKRFVTRMINWKHSVSRDYLM